MSKIEQKEIRLEIEMPLGSFPKTMFFNRFRVDNDNEFKLIQFGLVVASDLVDGYSCVLPKETVKQNQTEAPSVSAPACQTFCAGLATIPDESADLATNQQVVLTLHQNPTAWDRKLEREFRALALAEAKGALSQTQGRRLEYLSRWRNLLLHGQSTEEILFQLKRDRLLARMESVLKEYVDFQDGTSQKRAGA